MEFLEIIRSFGGIVIATAALLISWRFNESRKRITHDQMKKELFSEFNQRYNLLDDILLTINPKESYQELKIADPEKARVLNKYIDLCSEEYFWYKRGRLDEDIWKAWNTGMQYWYGYLNSLQDLWEIKSGGGNTAFYLNEGKDFFLGKV